MPGGPPHWRFRTGTRTFRPAVAGRTVTVLTDGGVVASLGAATGQPRWTADLDADPAMAPAAGGGVVAVVTADGVVVGLDAESGRRRWRFDAPAALMTAPTIAGETLCVADAEGTVYGIALEDGGERWRVSVPGSVMAPLVTDGDAVAFGLREGGVYAVDPDNGGRRWHCDADDAVTGGPAVTGDVVAFGTRSGSVSLFDRSSPGGRGGRQLAFDAPVRAVRAAGGTVFVATDAAVRRFRLDGDPAVRWEYPADGEELSALATDGDAVLAGDQSGRVHVLDAAAGRERFRFQCDSTAGVPKPVATAETGRGFVGGPDPAVYGLRTDADLGGTVGTAIDWTLDHEGPGIGGSDSAAAAATGGDPTPASGADADAPDPAPATASSPDDGDADGEVAAGSDSAGDDDPADTAPAGRGGSGRTSEEDAAGTGAAPAGPDPTDGEGTDASATVGAEPPGGADADDAGGNDAASAAASRSAATGDSASEGDAASAPDADSRSDPEADAASEADGDAASEPGTGAASKPTAASDPEADAASDGEDRPEADPTAEPSPDPDPSSSGSKSDTDLAEHGDRIEELESELSARGERIGELENELSAREERIEELEAELSDRDNRIRTLENERSDREERIEELEAEVESLRTGDDPLADLLPGLIAVYDRLAGVADGDGAVDPGPVAEAAAELEDLLADHGIERTRPDSGTPVDDRRHEVVGTVESGEPADHVVAVERAGYRRGSEVLRPARVTASDGSGSVEAVEGFEGEPVDTEGPLYAYEGRLHRTGGDEVRVLSPAPGLLDRDFERAFVEAVEEWRTIGSHPTTVDVVDYGELPIPWAAVPWREYDRLPDRVGEFDLDERLSIVADVADAVRNADKYKFRHRRLTPRSVWIARDADDPPAAAVAGWGIRDLAADRVDGSYVVPYTAPEQLDGGPVGGHTDVYQLGALAYTLLTDTPPYDGERDDLRASIREGSPTPPSERDDRLTSQVDDVVLRAMAADPAERYNSSYNFRVELADAL